MKLYLFEKLAAFGVPPLANYVQGMKNVIQYTFMLLLLTTKWSYWIGILYKSWTTQ